MIPKADIVDIIQQLIKVSLPSDKLDRPDEIRNLTPICDISEGPPPPTDPEFSFYISKVTPKGHELIFNDMKTIITSEELYPSYRDMPREEFIKGFNKIIYVYVYEQFNEAKKRNIPDNENIWSNPNIAFVNWFQENGIDIDSVKPFNVQIDIIEDTNDALWAIADDMRSRKEEGEFETLRESYRWAASHMTCKGRPITMSQLEKSYHKAKSEGKL